MTNFIVYFEEDGIEKSDLISAGSEEEAKDVKKEQLGDELVITDVRDLSDIAEEDPRFRFEIYYETDTQNGRIILEADDQTEVEEVVGEIVKEKLNVIKIESVDILLD